MVTSKTCETGSLAQNRGFISSLCLLVCISALAIDISLPAIPLIAESLGASMEQSQLTVSIYLAGFALGQIPVGLLADRYGRLPVLMAGLALFTGASLICSCSLNINILLAARFFQGLGGSVGPLLARAIVRDIATGNLAARHMALMVTALGVATLLGPVIGSGLIILWGWRSTYLFSVLTGIAIAILIKRYVPETRPFTQTRKSAWAQLKFSSSAFFSSRQSLLGLALVALPFGGYMTIVTQWSTVIVDVYGLPPQAFGPIFALAALAYILGAMLSRKWVEKYGVNAMLKVSIGTFAAATIFLFAIIYQQTVSLPILWAAITIYLLGIGFIIPNATSLALEPLPQSAGFSASIVGTAQITFSSLMSSVAATFYSQTIMSMTVLLAGAGALTVGVFLCGRIFISDQRLMPAEEC